MKNFLLNIVFKFLRIITLNYRFSRASDTLMIFVFHKVSDKKSKYHTPLEIDVYKKLCLFLKKHYEVIHFKDVKEYFDSKKSRPAAIITFDDGLIDIIQNVLPFMKENQIKFNINIDSEILETGKPQDFLKVYDILNYTNPNSYFDSKYMGDELILENKTPFQVEDEFTKILTKLNRQEKRDFVSRMAEKLKMNESQYYGVINSNLLFELNQDYLLEIGSHTHSHPVLTELTDESIKDELTLSKEILENCIRENVNIIAYPNGACNDKIDKIAFSTGYSFILKSENIINHKKNYSKGEFFRINQYHNSFEIAIAHSFGITNKFKNILRGKIFNS